ncbi:MAG: GNAT family N-acetyltransferase [Anaerolineae bacterium]|jgi:GNAT superfamily N-acetyltransferase|nr:GNAT family N-acetyltransferase [Anaerolineae bacterium]MBT4309338.1 GNAT family N-acetyltransferase [Anaerolineae bacterium]MBT4458177.1 GNAT family N-acetyltransferase [Anaerolineae bacterium]MBT4842330.1 GNAT family N-acetyltransferase [Anaerolineae bacterium]MBT6062639.1 GNAT family N-acetyltransferase [Anaerolineae bacterium]
MKISPVTELTDEVYEAFQGLIPQLSSVAPPTWDELSDLILADSTTLLVARQDNGSKPIIGALTLICFRVPTGLRAIVEDIIVDESARGQGVGEALIRESLRLAEAYGAVGLMLTSHPRRVAANKLYQKMKFNHWKTNVYFYEF